MPSPVAHGLAAYAALVTLKPQLTRDFRSTWRTATAAIFAGTLADADFLISSFTDTTALQHHFFSHSIPFAIALSLFVYLVLRLMKKQYAARISILFLAAYATHLLLDYFTEDGSRPYGIPLFWPFTDHHFQAPLEIFRSIYRGNLEILFGKRNFLTVFREALLLGPIALLADLHARSKK